MSFVREMIRGKNTGAIFGKGQNESLFFVQKNKSLKTQALIIMY
jgi:hypothetical protein